MNDPLKKEKHTHFGFETIPEDHKNQRVADVFNSVAQKYDLMNDVMSFGLHRLWKRFTILLSDAKPGQQILDLAGGTGDLSAHYAKAVGEKGHVILCDINQSMLQEGRNRLIDEGLIQNIQYVQANAETLPFTKNSFDCIAIAFGLRNVTYIDKALESIFNVLKPGGRLLILEFSHPVIPLLKPIYDAYSFSILPKLGKKIVNDEQSYQYLAESIRMHPNQEELKSKMADAKFEDIEFFNLAGGIVALHRGFKY